MTVQSVEGKPNHQWRERVRIPQATRGTARYWGEQLFGERPRVVRLAASVRDGVARPFGGVRFGEQHPTATTLGHLGPFAVFSETPTTITFGVDEPYLTLRSVLMVSSAGAGVAVTVETKVWIHSPWGWVSLQSMKIGHPVVVKRMLTRMKRNFVKSDVT